MSKRQAPIDESLLVETLKKYPAVYDTNLKRKKNKKTFNQAWSEIAEELRVPVQECRKIWRVVRDRNIKRIKKNINQYGVNFYFNFVDNFSEELSRAPSFVFEKLISSYEKGPLSRFLVLRCTTELKELNSSETFKDDEAIEEPSDCKDEFIDEPSYFKDEVIEEPSYCKDEVIDEQSHCKNAVIEEPNHSKAEVIDEAIYCKDEFIEEQSNYMSEVIEEPSNFKDEVIEEPNYCKDEVVEVLTSDEEVEEIPSCEETSLGRTVLTQDMIESLLRKRPNTQSLFSNCNVEPITKCIFQNIEKVVLERQLDELLSNSKTSKITCESDSQFIEKPEVSEISEDSRSFTVASFIDKVAEKSVDGNKRQPLINKTSDKIFLIERSKSCQGIDVNNETFNKNNLPERGQMTLNQEDINTLNSVCERNFNVKERKLKDGIFNIDTENIDNVTFFSKLSDYVTQNFSHKKQLDIRTQICNIITDVELEMLD